MRQDGGAVVRPGSWYDRYGTAGAGRRPNTTPKGESTVLSSGVRIYPSTVPPSDRERREQPAVGLLDAQELFAARTGVQVRMVKLGQPPEGRLHLLAARGLWKLEDLEGFRGRDADRRGLVGSPGLVREGKIVPKLPVVQFPVQIAALERERRAARRTAS